MKSEQIIMTVLDELVINHRFDSSFSDLTRNELFAFLLSPQGILKTLVQESFRDMSYYDAAYEIAHYEVVLALQEEYNYLVKRQDDYLSAIDKDYIELLLNDFIDGTIGREKVMRYIMEGFIEDDTE